MCKIAHNLTLNVLCKIPCVVVNMISRQQSIDKIRSSQSFPIKSNCVRSGQIKSDWLVLAAPEICSSTYKNEFSKLTSSLPNSCPFM